MDASLVGAGLGSFRGLEAHLPRPASKNQPETPAWGDAGPAIGDRGGLEIFAPNPGILRSCRDREIEPV